MTDFTIHLAYDTFGEESTITAEEAANAADAALEALALVGTTSVFVPNNMINIRILSDTATVFESIINAIEAQGLTVQRGYLHEVDEPRCCCFYQDGTYMQT